MNKGNKKYKVTSLEISSVNSILHTVNSLQGCIKNLLEITPDFQEFNKIKQKFGESDIRNALVNTDQMKFAVMLKNLYNHSKLEIFDQLLDYRSFIDRNIERNVKLEVGKKIVARNVTKDSNCINGLSCENFIEFSQFMLETVTSNPPLIPIKNDQLRQRVFTHKSVTNTLSSSLGSNEKLEFLGDSALYFLISQVLFFWFPSYDEGDMTNLRANLVLNAQLNKWSLEYNLDKKLMYDYGSNALDNDSKVLADLFEAYMGALAIENEDSYEEILFFLKRLIFPIVKAYIAKKNALAKKICEKHLDAEETNEIDLKSKNIVKDEGTNYIKNLYALVGMAACPPEYEIVRKEKVKQNFKVHCIVTLRGDILGRGIGPNAKLARREAAKDAMLNHKDLVDKHFKIRASIPRSQSVVSHKEDISEPGPENKIMRFSVELNQMGTLTETNAGSLLPIENSKDHIKTEERLQSANNDVKGPNDSRSAVEKVLREHNMRFENMLDNKLVLRDRKIHSKNSKKSFASKKTHGTKGKK